MDWAEAKPHLKSMSPVKSEFAIRAALKRIEELEEDFVNAASLASKHEQRAEAAEARLARIVELHKGVICCGPKCKAQDHEICCQHCSGPDCAPWPCPTVAAAKGEP